MSGVRVEVSRNRKVVCLFGVVIDGRLVLVLMVIVSSLNCLVLIMFFFIVVLVLLMQIVLIKMLLEMDDSRLLKRQKSDSCVLGVVCSIKVIIGVNRCWLIIIVIIVKKIVSSVVNGRVLVKVLLIVCLFVILLKVVVRIIIERLISLILVRWKVSVMISQRLMIFCVIRCSVFWCVCCVWFCLLNLCSFL